MALATTNGQDNTATGANTLTANTTGLRNTAEGSGALFKTTTGSNNTASGFNALTLVTTGSNNIGLGSGAGGNLTTGNNNIDIGNGGVAGEGGVIRMGVQGTQTTAYLAGIYGAAGVSGVPVYVNSNGQLGPTTSSARFKQDIRDMDRASEAILALRPVTYEYKPEVDPQGTPQFGLVAEEVDKVCPELVVHDEKGQPYTVRYDAVNAMLLSEFLKEHRRSQEAEAGLRDENAMLKQRLADLEAKDQAREACEAAAAERLTALERLLPPVPTAGAPAASRSTVSDGEVLPAN